MNRSIKILLLANLLGSIYGSRFANTTYNYGRCSRCTAALSEFEIILLTYFNIRRSFAVERKQSNLYQHMSTGKHRLKNIMRALPVYNF